MKTLTLGSISPMGGSSIASRAKSSAETSDTAARWIFIRAMSNIQRMARLTPLYSNWSLLRIRAFLMALSGQKRTAIPLMSFVVSYLQIETILQTDNITKRSLQILHSAITAQKYGGQKIFLREKFPILRIYIQKANVESLFVCLID